MLTRLYFALFLCFFAWMPTQVKAYDLGITPNHVHNLWLNINLAFLELQKDTNLPEEKIVKLEQVELETFSEKNPSDVYAIASELYEVLAQSIGSNVYRKYDSWVNDFDSISGRHNQEPTPSMVFVLSSDILNLLVETYLAQTLSKKPVGRFYSDYGFEGNTPSDVFAQVNLLKKRLLLILPEDKFAQN